MNAIPFREIVISFFKTMGIPRPTEHLARRAGVRDAQIWTWYRKAEQGVGRERGELNPVHAGWFIYESERLFAEADNSLMWKNPVRDFLEIRLNKFYEQAQQNTEETK